MRTQKEELLHKQLSAQLPVLKRSADRLSQSFNKCSSLARRSSHTSDDLEAFDALASRFARTADMLTQKVLGLVDALEFEEKGTFLDVAQRAEKRGLVTSAVTLKEVRELRNLIAHEYVLEDLDGMYTTLLAWRPLCLR